jgi:hypothetical protein
MHHPTGHSSQSALLNLDNATMKTLDVEQPQIYHNARYLPPWHDDRRGESNRNSVDQSHQSNSAETRWRMFIPYDLIPFFYKIVEPQPAVMSDHFPGLIPFPEEFHCYQPLKAGLTRRVS